MRPRLVAGCDRAVEKKLQHQALEKKASATIPIASAACVCPIEAVLTIPASAHIAIRAKSKFLTQWMPSA
jgi:hypothetical protein